MNKILRTLWLISFLVSVPGILAAAELESTTPPAAATGSEYTITVIPFYSPDKIWTLYTPFVDFLRESTGKPWTLKIFPSHEALLNGLCNDQVALALLGPVPLGKVMDRCNAEPLLVALTMDGTPYYRSVIVSTNPDITSIDGLRGKRLGFFKGSTAAHILPRKLLHQAGLNKDDFVSVFFEGQDHIVKALLSRLVDAAGLKEALFNRFKDQGLQVLAISKPLPNFTFAAAPNVSAATKKLFADTLLQLAPASSKSDNKLMATWDDEIRNGFTPPTDTFRNSVKDLLTVTNEIMRDDQQ